MMKMILSHGLLILHELHTNAMLTHIQTLRIDYADIEVYNEYADEIADSVVTKFGALGATDFEFPRTRSTEPIAQEVRYVPGCCLSSCSVSY